MPSDLPSTRRLPIGVEPLSPSRAHARIWSPQRRRVTLVVESENHRTLPFTPEPNGYHSATLDDFPVGSLYRFQLDDDPKLYPDPTSRFQPTGPHGPSQLIDPTTFPWTDSNWQGITPKGQVLYELHIGTFTPEGTWDSAARQLPALRDLGITCLEIMPIADFPGRFGWGYDGVNLFAPTRLYGPPDSFRRFIDKAHSLNIGVILDVVYNHIGPDGNYLPAFSPFYFSDRHKNDWGAGYNLDGPHNAPVREFILSNIRHWITEYHLDGFRFDATQAIHDDSPRHILADIAQTARAAAAPRSIWLVNENEPQQTKLVRPEQQGGYGLDSLWNDDFHHSAMVALTGKSEAYYTDHRGSPQEFISAAKYGYLFQGQRYQWQSKRRGTPAFDLPPHAFINFLQNHDQIANSGTCHRAHQLASPAQYRAITALLLLLPQTPMLFQGQEYAADQPFRYFADHHEQLAKLVREGRRKEVSQFPSAATREIQDRIPDPDNPATFEQCKLNPTDRTRVPHARILQLHTDLLRLRREDPTLLHYSKLEGAVLGPHAFCLRFFAPPRVAGELARRSSGGTDIPVGDEPQARPSRSTGVPPVSSLSDRLLLVNLGPDLPLTPAPEPLLAPPLDHRWTTLFSTNSPTYDGPGTPPLDTEAEGWLLPAHSTHLLTPAPASIATIPSRIQTPHPRPASASNLNP